jgi:putative transposase
VPRYRLQPTTSQEAVLREHCTHARFAWNLAVEQQSWWRRGRNSAPGYLEQCRQLTEARAEFGWLRAGSQMIQQQALRDFAQAMTNFFRGTHKRPGWRKKRRNEGFRIVAVKPEHVRRLSRKTAEVWIPKAGWIRFRWSRAVPQAKSYRITCDRARRWHVAFAAIPPPVASPGTGEVVGVDRGVAVSAALSTGELLSCPGLRRAERARLRRLERRAARRRVRGRVASARLKRTYADIAQMKAREADRRRDWVEKTSTGLARRFDIIRVEDLKICGMIRSARGTAGAPGRNVKAKAGLNRGILANGWGLLVKRLEDKAPGRVQKISPAYTSMTCNACRHCEPGNRKSQAFLCLACGHADHADVNAARNIAAGHAVTARGGPELLRPVNREPHPALLSA